VPKGLIPDQDNDLLRVNLQAAQGTSYREMVDHINKVAPILHANPNIAEMFISTGGSMGSMNQANFGISLTPRRTRKLSAQQVLQQVRPQLARFPGFRATVTVPPSIQIGSRQNAGAYSLSVRSANTDELYLWARRLEDAITALSEVQDVTDNIQITSP